MPPLPSANDQYADLVLTHAVDLERFTADVKARVVSELRTLERELVLRLNVVDPTAPSITAYKKARLEALLKQTRDTIRTAYSSINQIVRKDSRAVARIESDFTANAINGVIGVAVNSVALSPEQLAAYTSDVLIEGAKSSVWWARQSADLQNKFSNQMRQGMQMGEPLNDLVRRVRGRRENGFRDGIMQTATYRAQALARTSVQAAANVAVEQTLMANDDVVKGLQWVSTLDGRTTPICIARDGKEYDLNKNPIGHELPWKEGPGRIHWGCRSSMVPILKSWKELSHSGAVRTGGRPTNIQGMFENRLAEMGMTPEEISTVRMNARASMTGQAAETLTYEDWLRSKAPAFQNRVLGRARADMWRAGRIEAADLVSQDGRPLNLDQLRALSKNLAEIDLEAKAAQAARYDPTVEPNKAVSAELDRLWPSRLWPAEVPAPIAQAGTRMSEIERRVQAIFTKPASQPLTGLERRAAAARLNELGIKTATDAADLSDSELRRRLKEATARVLTKTSEGGFRLRPPLTPQAPVVSPTGPAKPPVSTSRAGASPSPYLVKTMEAGTPGKVKELGGGINETLIVELKESYEGTSKAIKGVFKPVNGEAWRSYGEWVRKSVTNTKCTLAEREVMSYQVDRIAGIDLCPETVLRGLDTAGEKKGWGSFQRFIEGAQVQVDYAGREMTAAENYRMSLFDYLIGNTDRHGKNFMRLIADGTPVPIDHGYTFPGATPASAEGLTEFRSRPYGALGNMWNKKNIIPASERAKYSERLTAFLEGRANVHEGIPGGIDEFVNKWNMSPQEADAFRVRIEKAIEMLEKDTFHVRAKRYEGWGLES